MRLSPSLSLFHCLRLKPLLRPVALLLAACLVLTLSVSALFRAAAISASASVPAGSGGQTTQPTENKQQMAALMYHHLLKKEENSHYQGNGIVTYTEDFEAQLKWLSDQGFSSVTPAQVEGFLYDGQALPLRAVLITFDDGYLSNAVYAAPLLRKYGFTATVFLVTEKLSETSLSFHPEGIQMMSPAELESCADVFTYASHTHNLHQTTFPDQSAFTDGSEETIRKDLSKSLEQIGSLKSGCSTAFSYPYGFQNEHVQNLLRAAGIRAAFRATGGLITASSDPLDLPRYDISYQISLTQFAEYLKPLL
ncbi:MAG: polysaccharide deacetylase family protein [Clostridiales bacterium]|nr:polysaccharide deacetylase family protein [Clostridiales bacterium]